jgi:hypothetical protein
MKTLPAVVLLFSSLFIFAHRTRSTTILPMSNVTRLEWLNGFEGLDCTSFLIIAHGDRQFIDGDEWYRNANPKKFAVVRTFASRDDIDESQLQPGDIAAFVGRDGKGRHVAAFLHAGLWIDSDYRRGNVDAWDMSTHLPNDDWFSGEVRILRWR